MTAAENSATPRPTEVRDTETLRTPWTYDANGPEINDADGLRVACVLPSDPDATDELGEAIIKRVNSHDALVEAATAYLATNPVFRSKPMGGEGSEARLRQQDQIAAEDTLRAALTRARAALRSTP